MGRPTDYKDEYNDLAFKFSLLGATDKQMSGFFGVSEVTLNAWKKKHPEFLKSLKDGKVKADAEVANALFHRAKGYTHQEEKIFMFKGMIVRADTLKHYAPDTAACMIWLKNRAGWRDSRDTDGIIDNAEEHFKTIADAISKSDTDPKATV